MNVRFVIFALLICTAVSTRAQDASDSSKREISSVLAHAIHSGSFTCTQHGAGEIPYLGDDLGQDCLIQKFVESDGRLFARTHQRDGYRNEDWHGWNQIVLSPCRCIVESVSINPVVNRPGKLGKPPASSIVLLREDGVRFSLSHITDPSVAKGDQVQPGDSIARVGNNGYSRAPHIHIGAYKGRDGLQIQWDLKTVKNPP